NVHRYGRTCEPRIHPAVGFRRDRRADRADDPRPVARPDAHRPAVHHRHDAYAGPRSRALRRHRDARDQRLDLRHRLRAVFPERPRGHMVVRRADWRDAGAVRGRGAAAGAARNPPAHGLGFPRPRADAPARATGLSGAELRAEHRGGAARGARHLRRHPGRLLSPKLSDTSPAGASLLQEEPMKRLTLLVCVFWASAAFAQEPTIFEYAVKFVCGKSEGKIVAPGEYFTAINVHNPNDEKPVGFRKKFAI